jgi:ABC-2 type transport system permease protein
MALLRLSLRRATGLRRSWRQKVAPWTLLGLAAVPAIVQVGVAYVTRDSVVRDFSIVTYREYVGVSTTLLLFVALTAPDIVCPDRRNRVLPLLFARPLTGDDYVAAKVGAIALILFGFGFLPQVVLFIGQLLVANEGSLTYFRHNTDVLWQVPLAVAVLAVHYSCIGVALASTTSRRVVGGVAILAVALVTSSMAGILGNINSGPDGSSAWGYANVLALPLHVRDLIFLGHIDPSGPLGGVPGAGAIVVAETVLIVAACLLHLHHRYREVLV